MRKCRTLRVNNLQFDELWGFIGKKERHVTEPDISELGDVWTFVALDADTKLVPSFRVGKRTAINTHAFVADIASRITNRPEVTTDGFEKYLTAIEDTFGIDVDYAQLVKNYSHDHDKHPERRGF